MSNTVIQLKKSATPGAVPTSGQLANGELAYNFADNKLFAKNTSNIVVQVNGGGSGGGNSFETVSANGTLVIADSNTDTLTLIAGMGVAITGNATNDSIILQSKTPIQSTAPDDPIHGSTWWDNDTGLLFIYYDDGATPQWVAITPTTELAEAAFAKANAAANVAYARINVGGSIMWANSNNEILTLIAGTNVSITLDAPNDAVTISSTGGSGGGGNSFGNVAANGTTLAADSAGDTLTLIAGLGIGIVGNATNDSIEFYAQIPIAQTAPGQPRPGTLWWNSDDGVLYIYYTDEDSSQWVSVFTGGSINTVTEAVQAVLSNGASVLNTGVYGDLEIPFSGTISQWSIYADTNCSMNVELTKGSINSWPPATVITGSQKLTISGNNRNTSTTLTGWTTSIDAGDVLRFSVNSANTVTRATISLRVRRN